MYLLIQYPGGAVVEGIVLGQKPSRLRVAAAGFADAVELKCANGNWFTAERQPVELEFLMSCEQQAEVPTQQKKPEGLTLRSAAM